MATMTNGDLVASRRTFVAEIGNLFESCGITRTQLASAVVAVDQWCSDNATSYNNALPTAAKNNLTSAQKARLLAVVLRQRFIAGV